MNIKKSILASFAMLSFAACSGGNPVVLSPHPGSTPTPAPTFTPTPGPTVGPNTQFKQIELLSRPAVKEVFESFQHHQQTNASEPYNDPTIKSDIVTTEDTIRPPNAAVKSDYGKLLEAVLYPNEYLVNLNGAAPSGNDPYYFLSTEVEGAFGGRAPNDDVIGLELSILFGGTLPALGLQPEDGEENNCLQTQNLVDGADPAKSSTATFPYLPAPR
jgi:hypothetical protein